MGRIPLLHLRALSCRSISLSHCNLEWRITFQLFRSVLFSGFRDPSGLIGFSQWGVDCGGYIRGTNDPTEELWARWMHFSTFSPVYEIMIGTNHTPWYPPYTSRLVSILKETTNLHNSLIPYIKSYTYQATQTGVPVIRALLLEYPQDPKVYTTTDTYAVGEGFLVAPILNAGGTRSVYFPTGTSYLEYFNKTDVYQGGTTHSILLEWESVPVYVREGAIIPTGTCTKGIRSGRNGSPTWRFESSQAIAAQNPSSSIIMRLRTSR